MRRSAPESPEIWRSGWLCNPIATRRNLIWPMARVAPSDSRGLDPLGDRPGVRSTAPDRGARVAPSPPAPPAPLAVRAVVPDWGPANSAVEVRILGTGFQPGATVTLGVAATNVSVIMTMFITATTPLHPGATADGGGHQPGRGERDPSRRIYIRCRFFIGQFHRRHCRKRNDGELGWRLERAQRGIGSGSSRLETRMGFHGPGPVYQAPPPGTFELTAPAQPGRYEFRYLLDDGYVDVARSREVTVTALLGASGSPFIPAARAHGRLRVTSLCGSHRRRRARSQR